MFFRMHHIFILHYILFDIGLTAILVLLALYLQTYSEASLGEIGTLLMVLPFLSILIKPFFCALADRQQAHKQYLMGALSIMALGYGSLAIAPFFPDWLKDHGRLVWYLDICGIIIGFSAFGVVWSLGDALSINAAQVNRVPWSTYRVWAVVAWGVGGAVIAQINELPYLPKFTPAFFVLVLSLLLEIALLAVWPNKHFVMGGCLAESDPQQQQQAPLGKMLSVDLERNQSLNGTPTKSLAGKLRRAGLSEVLEQHETGGRHTTTHSAQLQRAVFANSKQIGAHFAAATSDTPATPYDAHKATISSRSSWRNSLSRMNSLSAKSGQVILAEVPKMAGETPEQSQQNIMLMSSLASQASLGRATAARALGLSLSRNSSLALRAKAANESPLSVALRQQQQLELEQIGHQSTALEQQQQVEAAQSKEEQDLQIILLKLIFKRDTSLWKYLIIFTLFGILFTTHLSYFFLHLKELCLVHKVDFSSVTGGMLVAHSVSEVLSFSIIVPFCLPKIGRVGGLCTCALVYLLRFSYYGTYYSQSSPFTGIIFEMAHGIAYGIIYSLITEIAGECVDHVDDYLPELVEKGLIRADADSRQLKLPLRATMQGVFSGAFDGLGNGIGALFGGFFLDAYSFPVLWQCCAYMSLAVIVIYPLSEWRSFRSKPKTTDVISPQSFEVRH